MNKIILIITLTLLFAGCKKDPLDITPDGRGTLEDVFKDEKQTEAYLNAVYNNIPSYFYKYFFFSYLEGATDNAQDADVGNESLNVNSKWITGALNPSYNPLEDNQNGKGANHYVTFWRGIKDANVFLANIASANVPIESNRQRFKGEAQILRAFFYLELIKQYGAMPIVEKPFDNTFEYSSLKRPTFQQCIDFIVKECNEAIANADVPIRIKDDQEKGRFSKAVAYIIKSEALLYNASPLWNSSNDVIKWRAAAAETKAALTALTAGNEYQLFPVYEDYFNSTADLNSSPRDKETIFEINDGSPGTFTNINAIAGQTGQFKTGSTPSQELVDAYEMKATGLPAIAGYSDEDHLNPIVNAASGYDANNPYVGRDPRFYASVWYNGALHPRFNGVAYALQIYKGGAQQLIRTPPSRKNTHTGYYLRKMYNPQVQGNQGSAARFKKYHLAELYLNLAEAENEANGPNTEAYAAVNVIRARAGMPPMTPSLSKEQFRERVRNERRVELFMEEHRFWDVRRWKILTKTDKLVTGMEIIRNGTVLTYNRFVTERRFAWPDKYLIFPIPITDASIIPDFSLNQNPGW